MPVGFREIKMSFWVRKKGQLVCVVIIMQNHLYSPLKSQKIETPKQLCQNMHVLKNRDFEIASLTIRYCVTQTTAVKTRLRDP